MREIVDSLMENHRMNEMSTVGRFIVSKSNKPQRGGEYKVFTTSDGDKPQVHVHIRNQTGEFNTCVKLDKAEYFLHGKAKDRFDKDQLDSFINFMKSPSKQRIFTVGNTEYKLRTYWDYTIATWNEENPNNPIKISIDSEGYIVTPEIPKYNIDMEDN